ncbi:MAG TPA: MYXO-CTERM sorting domain-containing protein, partial [Polyangiaceae bacterium]
ASLLALGLFGLVSRSAHAQSSCSADSDCVKGWTCQVSGGSTCASPACPPGEKCEPQPNDCVTEVYKSCQPGACLADSDCADGMVCYTHTETNCPPTACASGQACPTPSCEPKTESACVPRYLLPCTTAQDCGVGFTCEPSGEQCACSGSAPAGSGASDGGTPPPAPEEPSCTCETSKELRCRAATVSCNQDSDCSAGWSCAAVGATADCASAPAPNPSPDGGAQGGATPAPDCRPSAQIKQCVPPYYSLIQGVSGVSHDSSGSPTLGSSNGASGTPAAVPPTAESGKDDNDSGSASAGCSVAGGAHASSALAVLGALGLLGALRRRRAR